MTVLPDNTPLVDDNTKPLISNNRPFANICLIWYYSSPKDTNKTLYKTWQKRDMV